MCNLVRPSNKKFCKCHCTSMSQTPCYCACRDLGVADSCPGSIGFLQQTMSNITASQWLLAVGKCLGSFEDEGGLFLPLYSRNIGMSFQAARGAGTSQSGEPQSQSTARRLGFPLATLLGYHAATWL